jgi:hypothetical protein
MSMLEYLLLQWSLAETVGKPNLNTKNCRTDEISHL